MLFAGYFDFPLLLSSNFLLSLQQLFVQLSGSVSNGTKFASLVLKRSLLEVLSFEHMLISLNVGTALECACVYEQVNSLSAVLPVKKLFNFIMAFQTKVY